MTLAVRLLAHKLEVRNLEILMTPPGDVLGHYLQTDLGIKDREDALRRCVGGCICWQVFVGVFVGKCLLGVVCVPVCALYMFWGRW